VWLRATPSPSRSPCRVAGQSATCKPSAKDLFRLWRNRRGLASKRWSKRQESFYRARPCQGTVRLRSTTRAGSTTGLLSSVPLRALASRQGYCPPRCCGHRPHDKLAALRSAAAIALKTCRLHSVPLRRNSWAHLRSYKTSSLWVDGFSPDLPTNPVPVRNGSELGTWFAWRQPGEKPRLAAPGAKNAHRRRTRPLSTVHRLCCLWRAPIPLSWTFYPHRGID